MILILLNSGIWQHVSNSQMGDKFIFISNIYSMGSIRVLQLNRKTNSTCYCRATNTIIKIFANTVSIFNQSGDSMTIML